MGTRGEGAPVNGFGTSSGGSLGPLGGLLGMFPGLPGSTGGTGATPAPTPGAMPGVSSQTFAQGFPGQIDALAQQMSAGFGQPMSVYQQGLDSLYNPVTLQHLQVPISALQESYKGAKTKPSVNTGNPFLDKTITGAKSSSTGLGALGDLLGNLFNR